MATNNLYPLHDPQYIISEEHFSDICLSGVEADISIYEMGKS